MTKLLQKVLTQSHLKNRSLTTAQSGDRVLHKKTLFSLDLSQLLLMFHAS